jgi:glycosyltransferase involved in cell wall biosynthesis
MANPEVDVHIFVAIPVYNHALTLHTLVEQVLEQYADAVAQVLVVDDGSNPPVAQDLAELDVEVLSHMHNHGKGEALLSAARWGLQRGMSHMICLDADGQHDPVDIATFIRAIQAHPDALIVGCRDFDQRGIPAASRFGRKFSNFWLRLQTGVNLKDSQSGFRAYPLFIFEELTFWTRRYNFEVEVLVRAAWAQVPLRDVDIRVYYPPGAERISHFRKGMDNWRLTLLNTHLTLRSIVPWPHRKISHLDAAKCHKSGVSAFHPLRSIRRLLQENSTPERLALASGVGVFLGALPLILCHTVTLLFVCGFFRLNKVAAVSSSQLCMPPLVPALCIEVGYYMRNGTWLTEFSLQTLGYQAVERIYEWFLGSLLVGPILGLLVGGITLVMAQRIKLAQS